MASWHRCRTGAHAHGHLRPQAQRLATGVPFAPGQVAARKNDSQRGAFGSLGHARMFAGFRSPIPGFRPLASPKFAARSDLNRKLDCPMPLPWRLPSRASVANRKAQA